MKNERDSEIGTEIRLEAIIVLLASLLKTQRTSSKSEIARTENRAIGTLLSGGLVYKHVAKLLGVDEHRVLTIKNKK